jgi:hypothetical protein
MLSEKEQEKVEIVFISVDVKRDTLEVMKERLAHYSKNFIGGVHSEEKLRNLMAKFGASYTVYAGKDPDDVAIDHTSEVIIINEKGTWVNSLKYDSTPDELFAAYKSDNLSKPIEVDFEGIEQNMGYIRPKLMLSDSLTYKGHFYIPSCELPQMQWRARLILQTPKGQKGMNFYFKSSSEQP